MVHYEKFRIKGSKYAGYNGVGKENSVTEARAAVKRLNAKLKDKKGISYADW